MREYIERLWRATNLATQWTTLRPIGNSAAARLVIVIPLIGYWIIFNDQLVQGGLLSPPFRDVNSDQHISYRLYLTYFGLCFVGLASFLYQCKCPPEVKLFAMSSEYVAQTVPHLSGLESKRIVDALERGDCISKAVIQEMASMGAPNVEDQAIIERWRASRNRNWLDAYFGLQDRSHLTTRRIVGASFALGFIALALPGIDIFCRVVGVLAHGLVW